MTTAFPSLGGQRQSPYISHSSLTTISTPTTTHDIGVCVCDVGVKKNERLTPTTTGKHGQPLLFGYAFKTSASPEDIGAFRSRSGEKKVSVLCQWQGHDLFFDIVSFKFSQIGLEKFGTYKTKNAHVLVESRLSVSYHLPYGPAIFFFF